MGHIFDRLDVPGGVHEDQSGDQGGLLLFEALVFFPGMGPPFGRSNPDGHGPFLARDLDHIENRAVLSKAISTVEEEQLSALGRMAIHVFAGIDLVSAYLMEMALLWSSASY